MDSLVWAQMLQVTYNFKLPEHVRTCSWLALFYSLALGSDSHRHARAFSAIAAVVGKSERLTFIKESDKAWSFH